MDAAAGAAGRIEHLGDGRVLGRTRGRERRNRAYSAPVPLAIARSPRRPRRALSAGHPTGRSRPSRRENPEPSSGGNSATPESSRKHLKPKTPASCSGRKSLRLSGTAPPQKPTSTYACPRARSAFGLQRGRVRRRRDAVQRHVDDRRDPARRRGPGGLSKPSHSVRPGSLTWTWVSTSPGSSTSS